MLAHEFHHLIQWRMVGYGDTLFDAIVTEGSAVAFEVSFGGFLPSYARPLTQRQETNIQTQLRRDLHRKDYNRTLWFWGKESFPRSAGYRLGYRVAKNYLVKYPTLKPQDLVHLPSSEFSKLLS